MLQFYALCPRGVEDIACDELKTLGATNLQPQRGGVGFQASKENLYRIHLHSRLISRVLMPLKEFSAVTKEMLYSQASRLKWEDYLNPSKTFSVECIISKSGSERDLDQPVQTKLTHSHYVALKIKDAIVDRLRSKFGERPNVDTERPHIKVVAYLSGSRLTINLDATVKSLHERGYRQLHSGAPLKENLAAAIMGFSGWDGTVPLIDPMCGSGSLLIEGVMKALNRPPNLERTFFGFMGWPDFDAKLLDRLRMEAKAQIKTRLEVPVWGYDYDDRAILAAKKNAMYAGVNECIRFEKKALGNLERPEGFEKGVMVMNPPYGERLSELERLKPFYTRIGDTLKQKFKGWTGFIFTGNLELAKAVGLKTSKKIPLFNGPIECRLLKYDLY